MQIFVLLDESTVDEVVLRSSFLLLECHAVDVATHALESVNSPNTEALPVTAVEPLVDVF